MVMDWEVPGKSDDDSFLLFRAPLEESRKWGIYYTTNLLFKTYFKVRLMNLFTIRSDALLISFLYLYI